VGERVRAGSDRLTDRPAGSHRDRTSVRFLVDGVQMQSWASGVTRSSMYLYVNAWFPSWLAGESPASDQSTLVDWIAYSAS